jgi:hypothetical protein
MLCTTAAVPVRRKPLDVFGLCAWSWCCASFCKPSEPYEYECCYVTAEEYAHLVGCHSDEEQPDV